MKAKKLPKYFAKVTLFIPLETDAEKDGFIKCWDVRNDDCKFTFFGLPVEEAEAVIHKRKPGVK